MRAISTLFLLLSTLLTLAFGGWLYLKLEREASLPEGFFGVWAGGYTIVGAALLLFILGVVLRVVSRPAAPGLPQALSTPPGSIPEAAAPAPQLGSSATPEPWEAPSPPLPSPPAPEPAAEEPEPWEPVSAPGALAAPTPEPAPQPTPTPEPAPAVVESLATSGGEAFRVVESKPAVRSREPELPSPPKPAPPTPVTARPVMTSSPLPSLPAGKSFVQDLATADVETTAAFHAAPELAEVLASLTSDDDDPPPAASGPASQPSGVGLPFEAGDVDELFAGLGEGLQEAFPAASSSSSRSAARATNPSVPALSLGGQDLQARLQSLKNQVSAPRTTALPDGQVGKAPPARNKFDVPTRRVPGQEMVSPDLLTSGSAQLAKPAPTPTSPSSTPLFMRSVQDIMGNESGLPTDPFDKEIGGMPPAEANALWREYVEANRRCNRDLSRLKHEVFQDHLERNYAAICKRFECKSVSFSVKIKDGRVSLQATPVK